MANLGTYTSIEELKDSITIRIDSESIFGKNINSIEIYSTAECTEFRVDVKTNVIGDSENIAFLSLYEWINQNNYQGRHIYIILPETFKSEIFRSFAPVFVSTLRSFNQRLNCNFTIIGYGKNGKSPMPELSDLFSQENLDFIKIKIISKKKKKKKKKDIAPSIFINQDNFKYYFQKSINDLLNEDNLLNIENRTYEEFKNLYAAKFNTQHENLNVFFIIHYYKLLDNIHCINNNEYYKTGNFKETKYYKYVQTKFINNIVAKPIYFTLILFHLLNEKIVEDSYIKIYKEKDSANKNPRGITLITTEKNDILNEYVVFLNEQFNNASEIFAGIYELSKNIIEHSEPKGGYISIKSATKENLLHENIDNKDIVVNYFESISGKFDKEILTYLDILITDTGTIGIIETSLLNMKKEWRNIDEDVRKHDMEIIEREIKKCNNEEDESKLLFDMYFNGDNLLKLDRQANNSYKGLGIYLFTEFINQYNGLFSVETNKYESRYETINFFYYNGHPKGHIVNPNMRGTTYNIILPVTTKNQNKSQITAKIPEFKGAILAKGVYEKMLPLEVISGENITLAELNPYNLSRHVIKNYITNQDKIIVFSLKNMGNDNISIRIDRSMIYRSIYEILKKNPTIETIVINDIPQDLIYSLFKIYATFSKDDTGFLSKEKEKIILLFTENKKGKKYKEGVVIAGKNEEECKKINRYILNKNGYFKVLSGNYLSEEITDEEERKRINENLNKHILFSSGQLIRLDFFTEGYSYFETPAKQKLQKSIDNDERTIGYNWEHTHLKIGSKLHLDDFIYGKKMFQRSGEASNFAFSITRDIFKNIEKEISKSSPQTFYTLIGYGYYSELLVSRTCDFINNLFEYYNSEKKQVKFEYIIVKDEDKIKFSRYIHNLEMRETKDTIEKLIIIVPISSTLTTCLKIENAFDKVIEAKREKKPDIYNEKRCFKIQSPFYTPVVVGDNIDIEELQKNTKEYKAVNRVWKGIEDENKIITENREVRDRQGEEKAKRYNKFNIYIQSKWQLPEECKHCFPSSPVQERPLFVTDKVSVTPSLIFDRPKWYESDDNPYFLLKKETNDTKSNEADLPIINKIDWVHYVGDNNKHFNYYLHYLDFLNTNNDQLKKWINGIRNKFSTEWDSKVLLIAPDKSENGVFIHLINRELFDDRAEIIRFDKHSDHYLNFDKFFKDKIKWAKTIYFVDNLMLSGKTFLSVDEILKVSQAGTRKKRITGVFCLVNRMDYSCYHTVTGKLKENDKSKKNQLPHIKGFYSFITLNVPESTLIPCPLCDEKKKYEELKNSVSLDCFKQYLAENEIPYFKEVDKENLMQNELPYIPLNKKHNNNTLLKVALIHFLNKALQEYDDEKNKNKMELKFIERLIINKLPTWEDDKQKGNIDYKAYLDFNRFCKEFRNYIENQKPKQTNMDDREIVNDFKFKANLIKVLSSQSLKKYRGIYISVFYWVLCELIVAVRAILGDEHKFVGKYHILSKPENKQKLSDFEVLTEPCNNIDLYIDTVNYLRLLVKIASSLNVAYLLHIDFLWAINKLINQKEFKEKQKKLPEYENFKLFCAAHIIRSLYKNEQRAFWFEKNINELYRKYKEQGEDTAFLELLILENTSIIKQTLNDNNRKEDFDSFNANSEDYYAKVEIFDNTQKLKEILSQNHSNEYVENEMVENVSKIVGYDIQNGGGFLLYKYQDIDERSKNYIHIGSTVNAKTIAEKINPDNSLIINILEGIDYLSSNENNTQYTWSNFTIHKKDNIWIGQDEKDYSAYDDIKQIEGEQATRVLFIRISSYHKETSQETSKEKLTGEAIFVFYDNNEPDKNSPYSIHNVRFIHALRNEISEYLKEKYKTDTFKTLVEERKLYEDLLSTEHHYKHHIKDLYDCAIKNPDINKLYFFYVQVHDTKEIKDFMKNGVSSLNDITDIILKDKIDEYCRFILEPKVLRIKDNKIGGDLTIHFSEMIFREIVCEYLTNINNAMRLYINTLGIEPYVTINAQSENNNIELTIENNFLIKREDIQTLQSINNLHSNISGGLSVNEKLLEKIGSDKHSVHFDTTDVDGVGKFTVKFTIKNIIKNDNN
jgi:hypothetical protein